MPGGQPKGSYGGVDDPRCGAEMAVGNAEGHREPVHVPEGRRRYPSRKHLKLRCHIFFFFALTD